MILLADIAESKLGDQHGEISHWGVSVFQKKGAKLEYKINVLGEIAIGISATVFTSFVWLFLYIIGLKGYAIGAAIVLSFFVSMFIHWKLKRIWNKENPPRSSS